MVRHLVPVGAQPISHPNVWLVRGVVLHSCHAALSVVQLHSLVRVLRHVEISLYFLPHRQLPVYLMQCEEAAAQLNDIISGLGAGLKV